jgi:hypothetical protein
MKQLEATGTLARIRTERVFPARGRLGDSLSGALEAAEVWAAAHRPDSEA